MKAKRAGGISGERQDLIEIEMLDCVAVASRCRVANDLRAIGSQREIGQAREAQQVAVVPAIEFQPG
jgi:hypothetical protein